MIRVEVCESSIYVIFLNFFLKYALGSGILLTWYQDQNTLQSLQCQMIELTDVPVDILFKPMPFKIILLYLTQIQG